MRLNETCACDADARPTFVIPEAAAAIDLLAQCRTLIRALPDGIYTCPSSLIPGGTVGKHLRHLLDHYFALLDAADAGHDGATIDYDRRARDTATETSVLVGLAMLERAAARLGHADDELLLLDVRVVSMLAADGSDAEHGSTLGRELAFSTHHGLHHAAMIGAICREHGVAVSSDFGKAPSTIAHERRAVRIA